MLVWIEPSERTTGAVSRHTERPPGGSEARRHVAFLTSTRADFGKLKPLMLGAAAVPNTRVTALVTGMHMLSRYGSTVNEVRHLEPCVTVREFANQRDGELMDQILARTVEALGHEIEADRPDLLVVHGDRVEALAGAAVGALRGVSVAHVEGGELSGTIDGVLRHAVSKLAHLHLVANEEAQRRVVQLGEDPRTVKVIGSPDIDVMVSQDLPTLEEVLSAYEIPFHDYAIVIFHGVTTEPPEAAGRTANGIVDALARVGLSAVVVHPNNDPGSRDILAAYQRLKGDPRYRIFPSVRFEAFLTLLRHASVLIGNSSAGVREAPIYGTPSVNIGTRQRGRHRHPTIIDCDTTSAGIRAAVSAACGLQRAEPSLHFGSGESARRFSELLASPEIWELTGDKEFRDVPFGEP
jgi:UDP-N-acetylglucosamine 2-epimerase (hydrolysing)